MTTEAVRDLLLEIIETRNLIAVFQPIVDVSVGKVLGFEGLIRGPEFSPLHMPMRLFKAANQYQLLEPLEKVCVECIFSAFNTQNLPGKLFINVSSHSLIASFRLSDYWIGELINRAIEPERLVIEISEQYPLEEIQAIMHATQRYQAAGCEIAIDDLGADTRNI